MLEAEVALLDEVEQLHAGGQGVAAGDAHDEAEVGPDEPVLGCGGLADGLVELTALLAIIFASTGFEALLDDLAELALFLGIEERNRPDLVQVLSY